MVKEYKYVVATQCMTYNHALYIEDTLRGFAMQETTFPVVYMIVDDASTDGEQDVLKKWGESHLQIEEGEAAWHNLSYGKQILAPLKGNPNAHFLILLLNENHFQSGRGTQKMSYISEWKENAKYHALCEGDDFWVRPNKLQKQVDFLESHPDYSMCFHNAVIFYDDTPQAASIFNTIREDREVSLSDLVAKWTNPTASIVYRSKVLPAFPVNGPFISGDWKLTLHCAVCGKIWAMKDVMCFYRKTYHSSSSASRNSVNPDKTVYQKVMILESLDKYTEGKYHDILGAYIQSFNDYAHFLKVYKRRGKLIAYIATPRFTMHQLLKHFNLTK